MNRGKISTKSWRAETGETNKTKPTEKGKGIGGS
jgi:hypothetical protein